MGEYPSVGGTWWEEVVEVEVMVERYTNRWTAQVKPDAAKIPEALT